MPPSGLSRLSIPQWLSGIAGGPFFYVPSMFECVSQRKLPRCDPAGFLHSKPLCTSNPNNVQFRSGTSPERLEAMSEGSKDTVRGHLHRTLCRSDQQILEPRVGVEPTTCQLRMGCSTNELCCHGYEQIWDEVVFGAGERSRTVTTLRSADFESATSVIAPLRRSHKAKYSGPRGARTLPFFRRSGLRFTVASCCHWTPKVALLGLVVILEWKTNRQKGL